MGPMEKGWAKGHRAILLSKKTKILRNVSLNIFKTVNMTLFDASIGNYVYKKSENSANY